MSAVLEPPVAAREPDAEDVFVFPASRAQQRLWFLEQLGLDSPAYNIPSAFRILGRLDAEALRKGLDAIVARHESLRTTFSAVEGRPFQLVAPERRHALPFVDLSGMPRAAAEGEVRRLVREEAARRFALDEGPLLRTTLLGVGPEEHVLLVCMHHTISDGWSVGIFASELAELYGAITSGREPALPALPIQYADYALWEEEWLASPAGRGALSYWRKTLEGSPRPVELPSDRTRPAAPSFRGGAHEMRIDAERTRELKALSRREGITLFMTLLAGFSALVHRLTGETDLAIGSMAANRGLPETEGLIGFFVNALVYRIDVSGDPTFRALLARIKDTTVGAYANQQLPFERLVEELRPERDLAKNPLFCLSLTLQNPPLTIRLPGLDVTPMAAENETSKFDLSFEMWEEEGGVIGRIEYSTDLFDTATVQTLAARFAGLLSAASADPDRRLSALPLLDDADRASLAAWNDTTAPIPELGVERLVEAHAHRQPDAVALVVRGHQVTYAELDRRANRIARLLQRHGVGPGMPVGLATERSVEMVAGILGILKAGGAYMPLDASHPKERLARMLSDSKARVVLTERAVASSLPETAAARVVLDAEPALEREEDDAPPTRATADDLAFVLFTSGSTGTPKGVEVRRRGVSNVLESMAREMGITSADVFVATTGIWFDIASFEVLTPLAKGARLVLAGRDEALQAEALQKLVDASGATVLQATPSAWRTLLDAGFAGGPRLKLLTAGEALPRELAKRLLARGAGLWNAYGPTETTIYSSVHRVTRGTGPVPIGHAIANTTLHVVDRNLAPVPVGVPGELLIGGAGVARGYLGRAELTTERFVDTGESGRVYRTGDLVRWRRSGVLEYLGRLDDQVKIRGIRIELGEIESVLSEAPGVKASAVVALGEGPEKRLVAYVVPHDVAPGPARLRRYLSAKLPESLIPAAFVTLEALPLNANGKLDRRALPEPDLPQGHVRAFAPPANDVEKRLAAIWEEVLGVSPIGRDDNYFELGGHSLLAVRLFAQVEKAFKRQLPLATVFQAPTVARLAELLGETTWRPKWSSLVPIRAEGSKPPLYCVHAIGGNVLTYSDLARHLGTDQPVWGLQARGLDGKQPLPETLEEMAANYLREVRELQPHGPYSLCGSSAGGLVAFEMAQQLVAAGEEVGVLALFDTWGPDHPRPLPGSTPLKRQLQSLFERIDLHAGNFLIADGAREKLRYVVTKSKRLGHDVAKHGRRTFRKLRQLLGDEVVHPLPRALRKVENSGRRAIDVYQARPYPGRVTLFRASKQPSGFAPDAALGWSRVALGGVEIYEVPGHHGAIVYDPRARVLAAQLARCLEKVLPPRASAGAGAPVRQHPSSRASEARVPMPQPVGGEREMYG